MVKLTYIQNKLYFNKDSIPKNYFWLHLNRDM